MKEIIEYYKKSGSIHHFYILQGEKESIRPQIFDFLNKHFNSDNNIKHIINELDFGLMTIEDVRNLIERVFIKTAKNQKKFFIISLDYITKEAQNSLLKIVEEPIGNSIFFFISSGNIIFLPTILSRAILIKNQNQIQNNIIELFEIRKMKMKERIDFIEKMLKDYDKEKITKKDLANFIQNILFQLKLEIEDPDLKNKEQVSNKINTLYKINDYLNDTGCSVKILLERAILLL